jgi:hypothetical protein
MWDNNQTLCNIRMFGGFEIFNTRPYHNYETWAEGYEISTPLYGGVKVQAEDLDDALRRFATAVSQKRVEAGKRPVDISEEMKNG